MPRKKGYYQALYLVKGKRRTSGISLAPKIDKMIELYAKDAKTSRSNIIEEILNEWFHAALEYKERKCKKVI